MDPLPLIAFSLRIPSRMAAALTSAYALSSLQILSIRYLSHYLRTSRPLPAAHMVVNILAASQAALATRFARADAYPRPFEGVPYDHTLDGLPVLAGSLGALSCRLVAPPWPLHDVAALEGSGNARGTWEGEGVASELFVAEVVRVERTGGEGGGTCDRCCTIGEEHSKFASSTDEPSRFNAGREHVLKFFGKYTKLSTDKIEKEVPSFYLNFPFLFKYLSPLLDLRVSEERKTAVEERLKIFHVMIPQYGVGRITLGSHLKPIEIFDELGLFGFLGLVFFPEGHDTLSRGAIMQHLMTKLCMASYLSGPGTYWTKLFRSASSRPMLDITQTVYVAPVANLESLQNMEERQFVLCGISEDFDCIGGESAPAEPDQPLFHPCKCSGTIRYIHQDCLKEWLTHSRKKTCDVCKYPYSFTKVYSENMPERLPIYLILREVPRQVASAVLFILRTALVATVWLAALPYATIWTWRTYFALGNMIAWWISALPQPEPITDFYGRPVVANTTANTTTNGTANSTEAVSLEQLVAAQEPVASSLFAHPLYRSISSDIFSGQVIASFIVLTCVAVFLLREWINQNARPGIFDERDAQFDAAAPEAPPAAAPPPVIRQPAAHHLEAPRMPRPPSPPPMVPDANHRAQLRRDREIQDPVQPTAGPSRVKKPRTRESRPGSDDGSIANLPHSNKGKEKAPLLWKPRKVQLREGSSDRGMGNHKPRAVSAKARLEDWEKMRDPMHFASDRANDIPVTEFTFRANGPAYPSPPAKYSSIGRSRSADPPDEPPIEALPFAIVPRATTSTSVPAGPPHPVSPASSSRTHSSSTSPERFSSPPEDGVLTPVAMEPPPWTQQFAIGTKPPEEPAAVSPSGLRRPPLPAVTLPPSPPRPSDPAVTSLQNVRGSTPMESPSLATYRAPEELGAEPQGYFVHDDADGAEQEYFDEEEHRHYFRDPEEAEEEAEDDEDDDEDSQHWQDGDMDFAEVGDDGEAVHILDEVQGDMADDELDEGEWMDEEVVHEEEAVADAPEVGQAQQPDRPAPQEGVFWIDDIAALQNVNGPDGGEGGNGRRERRGPRVQFDQPFAEVGPQEDFDQEVNVEDDMDGALEAIGLRGPLVSVLQNAILMTIILDATIGLGIWLPFTIGKSTALLSLAEFSSSISLTARCLQYNRTSIFASKVMDQIAPTPAASAAVSEVQSTSSSLYRLLEEDTTVMRYAEPYFHPESKEAWISLATGDTPNDKMFAVLLGYAVVGLLLAIYLNILTVGSMRSAGRAVRHAVRQQLLVVKVATFIIIELVTFPLGCGVMLDICTVWLFPQGSFGMRAAFLVYAPVTAVFYHWVVGTMFMYQFAVLLSGCRTIMRPGAMWFIKDPQDQNFHPIRDILERPTFVQIRKLLFSAVIILLRIALGASAHKLCSEPLSEVPVDLIMLQLVLPYTMDEFHPRATLRKFGTGVWRYLASRLRLSSYMFGGRYPLEEFTPKEWNWRFLVDQNALAEVEHTMDGSFLRVPNNDNVALVKDSPATVEVLEDGTPVDEEARKLIDAQNREAQKNKRQVHDGYSFVVGFYLLWGCYLFGGAVERFDKRRQRRWVEDEERGDWTFFAVKRGLLWLSQAAYMITTLGIVLPTLLGIVIELYIVHPIRHTAHPNVEPRIRLVDMWALGVMYAKIMLRVLNTQRRPADGIVYGIERIHRLGFMHMDPFAATVQVFRPLATGLLAMILFPAALVWGVTRLLHLPVDENLLSAIRDQEFLVEMRLRNLEPEKEAPPQTTGATEAVEVEA
ncbi:uncharacterized protein BXZ73DRAFT_76777 [Epithele typhae]|uniref:uncharacterized protein n=1 Tax=Epithele typhae TaxID=378194 RepID=UPI0020081F5C|nr:uncharacterized protein BXZ73DRAFT_76777 [Epithele typhae]KAH9935970.1 hypothetical protein BXZ73DRAFT_76777 [Epithele typhae]